LRGQPAATAAAACSRNPAEGADGPTAPVEGELPGLGREFRTDKRPDHDAGSCRREFLGNRADAIEMFPHDPEPQIVGDFECIVNVVFVTDSKTNWDFLLDCAIEQLFRVILAGILVFAVAAGAIELPAELFGLSVAGQCVRLRRRAGLLLWQVDAEAGECFRELRITGRCSGGSGLAEHRLHSGRRFDGEPRGICCRPDPEHGAVAAERTGRLHIHGGHALPSGIAPIVGERIDRVENIEACRTAALFRGAGIEPDHAMRIDKAGDDDTLGGIDDESAVGHFDIRAEFGDLAVAHQNRAGDVAGIGLRADQSTDDCDRPRFRRGSNGRRFSRLQCDSRE
jgi:hypothetical protein